MPSVSKAQFRAMQAAAHGHSTLGIPASVGKDFVAATPDYHSLIARATKKSSADLSGETPAEEAQEPPTMGMAEERSEQEKHAHHAKMARKAGSPAARAVHRKLAAHHQMKMHQSTK